MGVGALVVTSAGLLASLVVLGLAWRREPRLVTHRALWIVALIALVLSILFRLGIGTAVVLPALTWPLEQLLEGASESSAAPAMLGFYALPALLTGVLLVLSTRGHARPMTRPRTRAPS